MWTTKKVFDDGSVLYFDAAGNVVGADPAPNVPNPGGPTLLDQVQRAAEKAAGTGIDSVLRSLTTALQPSAPAVTPAPSSANSGLVSVALLAGAAFLAYKFLRS